MRKLTLILSTVLILFSCKKENTPENKNETISGTTIVSGTIVSGVHPSSGTVKVVKDANSKNYLVFENFKTDNGPDLKVWLSTSSSASNYVEVGLLKAVSGNFYYELNATHDFVNKPNVLIWCKQFSVLFGSGVLK